MVELQIGSLLEPQLKEFQTHFLFRYSEITLGKILSGPTLLQHLASLFYNKETLFANTLPCWELHVKFSQKSLSSNLIIAYSTSRVDHCTLVGN